MFQITDRQIDFILDDLQLRGIRIGDLQQNLLDHICIMIEQNLEEDGDFETYYRALIPSFYKQQLGEIEEETIFLLKHRGCFAVLKRWQCFLLLLTILMSPIVAWTINSLQSTGQKNDVNIIITAWEGAFVFSLFPLISLLVLFLTPKRFDPLIPPGARIILGGHPFVSVVSYH